MRQVQLLSVPQIRAERLKMGLSRERFCTIGEIKYATYKAHEDGSRQNPTLATLQSFNNALAKVKADRKAQRQASVPAKAVAGSASLRIFSGVRDKEAPPKGH